MRIRRVVLGFFLTLFFSGLASAGPIFDGSFTGYYAPENWTLSTDGGDGYVDTTTVPGALWLYGNDDWSTVGAYTKYWITAPATGLVDVSWYYQSFDNDGPLYDPAGYFVNGIYMQLSSNSGAKSQGPFELKFNVNEGDTFGFYVLSIDGVFGRGALRVDVPEPASCALLGLGLIILGFATKRKRTKI